MATKHGMSYTPEYNAYKGAKNRCNNPKNGRYQYYGERGIRFLFNSFEEFYQELGPRPDNLTLDRIDTNGNYCVGNVQWSSQLDQLQNRRKYFIGKRKGKGYYWNKAAKKWAAQLWFKGTYYYLGLFPTENQAREAYENKLNELIANSKLEGQ